MSNLHLTLILILLILRQLERIILAILRKKEISNK